MKTFISIVFMLPFFVFVSAQVIDVFPSQAGHFYEIPMCKNDINIGLSSGSLSDYGEIIINWGDGEIDTNYYFINSMTDYDNYVFSHQYSNVGLNSAVFSVYSYVSSNYFVENVPITMITGDPSTCAMGSLIYVSQTNPVLSYPNAPIDFTDVDGVTTTLTPTYYNNNPYNYYFGLNPQKIPYTITVNPSWLQAQNLIIDGISTYVFDSITTNGTLYSSTALYWESLFYLTCAQPQPLPDVEINNGMLWLCAPLETGSLNLNITDLACQGASNVTVEVQFPDDFIPELSSLDNAFFSNGILTFDTNITEGTVNVFIPISIPGTTPAGLNVCLPTQVLVPNDSNPTNNFDTICGVVLNSYDPNDKQVNQPALIFPDVLETLTYQIRFQNDGNFPAVNVVIRDTLSENLDLSTFRFLNSSHPLAYQINSNTRELTFSFNGIWLESSVVDFEASQGFARYEIKEKAGLVEGDAIENTAYIFFDFNPPIITNTTVNVNSTLASNQNIKKIDVLIFPNPTAGNVNFSGDEVQKVVIYDLLGQVVITKNVTNNSISVSELNTGVYFLEIHAVNRVQTKKLHFVETE